MEQVRRYTAVCENSQWSGFESRNNAAGRVLISPRRGQSSNPNAREKAPRVHISLRTGTCGEIGTQDHPKSATKDGVLPRKDLTQDAR